MQQIATRAGLDWAAFQNMPIDQARAAVLNAMHEQTERTPIFSHVAIGSEGPNRAAEGYLFARMTGRRATGPAERYNGMSLTEFGRSWLAERGERVSGIGRDRIADQLLTARSYHTTSDFSTLLQSAGNRVL